MAKRNLTLRPLRNLLYGNLMFHVLCVPADVVLVAEGTTYLENVWAELSQNILTLESICRNQVTQILQGLNEFPTVLFF